MKFDRSSGILLHPTSLPGPFGIGELGSQAYRFIDFLAESGCGLWQVLPLGPTGYGNSPYQSFSTFAGNPYIISLELLMADNLINREDLADQPDFPVNKVDYGAVIPWKLNLLDRAYKRFVTLNNVELVNEFNEFQDKNASWLEDFAIFMALKDVFGGGPWVDWPQACRQRDLDVMQEMQEKYAKQIDRQRFWQYLFYRQWGKLRDYAHKKRVDIIGDIPIFVAHDSAEVWAKPELFYLDNKGYPTVVAGVPPDYFSETGQLWGNPLYRWEVHAAEGYKWWLTRLKAVLSLVDYVRLDHFRGFAGYWEIPASAPTAETGRWAPGPGDEFFARVKDALGELPIIAEDLGVITPDVVEMREKFNLPGMIVLQFAFYGDPEEPFLPHNHLQNRVVYTGTHDNDTTLGWYLRVEEEERDFCRRYLGIDGSDISWDLIRAGWASVSVFSLAPLQDFLGLGNEARMNYPGNPSGNWEWRYREEMLSQDLCQRIREFNFLYSRSTEKEDTKDRSTVAERDL